jgi:hypothetical protein
MVRTFSITNEKVYSKNNFIFSCIYQLFCVFLYQVKQLNTTIL